MDSVPSVSPEIAKVLQTSIDEAKSQLSELNLDVSGSRWLC